MKKNFSVFEMTLVGIGLAPLLFLGLFFYWMGWWGPSCGTYDIGWFHVYRVECDWFKNRKVVVEGADPSTFTPIPFDGGGGGAVFRKG
jgi:hypothetical protein